MKKGNEKDFDFVVYEPVKRGENDSINKEKEELKTTKRYSGLYNRGNTCYLNSLLQTLFMTQEFRTNILTWKFNENIHGKREDSIPFQLQKLFARLQLKLRECEMTEDLTKSFDWGHQQLLEQHDIQELCRVLFEAIEASLYETEDNFINNLFEGSSTSVVKCLVCNSESVKKDRFLDISLPVRNDYEKIYNTSLEMAFRNFLKKEKLEGDNQYKCENCDNKVDALKYLKFTKLPKILFLQLNRFEYDILTDGRRKICDRVTFPAILNMNPFLKDYDQIAQQFNSEVLKNLEQREYVETDFDRKDEYLKQGEYVYELYSVVVHSGSARGGHYYSYIKSFEDGNWCRFDDNLVYTADLSNILYTYGESTKTGLNAVTGYILMYRIINRDYKTTIDDSLITSNKELMDLIEQDNILIREEEDRQKDKMNTLQLKFVYNEKSASIVIKKNNTIRELKQKAMKEYAIQDTINEDNVRIRCVHNQTYKLLEAFSDENIILEESSVVSHKTYALEIKKDEEKFEDYNPDLIVLFVCKWSDEIITNHIEEKSFKFEKIKIDKKSPIRELKNCLFDLFALSKESELFVIKKVDFGINNYQVNELFTTEEEMNKEIFYCMLTDNSKLFLEIKDASWKESKFIKYFEDNCANITVRFNSPINKEILNSNANAKGPKKISRITFNSYKFENEIEIKKSKTLGEMKKRIAEMLKISENEFIMKKNSHNGNELRNLSDTIDKFATHAIDIYIEFGNPQKDSEVKINVFTCEYDYTFFLLFPYKTMDVGVFLVDLKWSVLELKRYLLSEFKKKGISFCKEDTDSINLDEILIREYKNDRPTKIFKDGSVLGKDLLFTENRKIIIQRYNETKLDDYPGDIQLTIREWNPSNWTISHPNELHFKKGLTFLEFAHKLHQVYPNLQPDRVSAFKVVNEMNVYMDDFKKFKFENLYEKNDFVLDHYPFFVNTDGSIIIIKDDSNIYREPTEEETRLFCRPKQLLSRTKKSMSSNSSVTSNSSSNSKLSTTKSSLSGFKAISKKEKGVVIKVKNNLANNTNEMLLYKQESNNSDICEQIQEEDVTHCQVKNKLPIDIYTKEENEQIKKDQ